MPRTTTPFLAAALLACCAAAAGARQGETKPAAPGDADALRAEQLCEQGRAHAARGADGRSEARRSFARALGLYLDVYTRARPGGEGSQARFREQMRERLRGAPRCVEDYLALGAGTPFERSQLAAFGGQAQMYLETDEARGVLLGSEVDARARITRRPEPRYPPDARTTGARGTVRLRAVLAADGTVRHVLVLKGLPHGLTEECVAAARGIRFEPAVKGGRPVSQFVLLEYNLSLY
ncbi:MAG TPA: energy transducer TonB [Pyrinomonadaceae bacterium]|jgi:TonB family protein